MATRSKSSKYRAGKRTKTAPQKQENVVQADSVEVEFDVSDAQCADMVLQLIKTLQEKTKNAGLDKPARSDSSLKPDGKQDAIKKKQSTRGADQDPDEPQRKTAKKKEQKKVEFNVSEEEEDLKAKDEEADSDGTGLSANDCKLLKKGKFKIQKSSTNKEDKKLKKRLSKSCKKMKKTISKDFATKEKVRRKTEKENLKLMIKLEKDKAKALKKGIKEREKCEKLKEKIRRQAEKRKLKALNKKLKAKCKMLKYGSDMKSDDECDENASQTSGDDKSN